AHWRTRRTEQSVLDSWRYDVDWIRGPAPTASGLSGHWLLVTSQGQHDSDWTRTIAHGLRDHGADVTELVLTDDTDREQLTALLAAHAGVTGVLSLLALDESPCPDRPVLTTGLALNLLLLQALA